jgi:predicted DNA-binding transcriptional regulator AlpA
MTTTTLSKATLTQDVTPLAGEFITADEFAAILRVSKRTLFRLKAKGVLPPPLQVSTNTIRWEVADVRAYLDELKPRRGDRRRGHR